MDHLAVHFRASSIQAVRRSRPASDVPMHGAMLRVLDPYHRIRALVAALFLIAVMALALVSMHGPRHVSVSSVSNVSTASAVSPGAVQPTP